jgi:DNA mismatch repair protein MutS
MNVRPDNAEAEAAPRPTPMMAQYFEIKAANPNSLLFYRMGDFYEMFFDDAEIASRALGIALTKRGKHLGEDILMCGVPFERLDEYLHRLIALGHRVAVAEQKEDPAEAKKRGAKSVVQRGVVRVVTPGTITEERLLEPGRANALLAIQRVKPVYGLAAIDISTGAVTLSETDEAGLAPEIARLEPREIVAPQSLFDEPGFARLVNETGTPATPMGREAGDSAAQERRVREFYGVETLEGFGAFSRAEIAACALALTYVERTQIDQRPDLAAPARRARSAHMEIDAATRANLEITRTLAGERRGSLLATLDFTKTPAGARLLAERLASPLTDPEAIAARLDAVGFFVAEPALRASLRGLLASAPDFLRALGRLAVDRGGPRDLAAVRDGWRASAAGAALLLSAADAPAEVTRAYASLAQADGPLGDEIDAAVKDELPLDKRGGDFVRKGFSAELDEARKLRDDSRHVIAEMQARYAEQTGAKGLKVKHNNFLGYFVEATQAVGETLLKAPHAETFIHRQTMQGAMRFTTEALIDLDTRLNSAADLALKLELDVFEALKRSILAASETLRGLGAALAELDVAASLAELAVKREWTRPKVDASLSFAIEGGRHPVVEAALGETGEPFVANDCNLSGLEGEGGRIAVVTGPNMAGKSTYLRQNALIAALAQMGSFVPARAARIGVVDRLFSRVGAADDLARGRSTFMVEMVETAAILNQATERSLVILDEIGRGTATYDGLSIAQACVERLNDANRCRTLFATHFHELTRLAETMPRLFNLTMRVREHRGALVFLHEIAPGVADRSYGVQVARLAGLPPAVVRRARALLADLEGAGAVTSLPLFAHEPEPARDLLREMLARLDPDALSPRDAQAMLYELKRMAAEG